MPSCTLLALLPRPSRMQRLPRSPKVFTNAAPCPCLPGFPYQLAAACDDGTVRLFTVEDDEPGAQLDRVLSVLQGRLLSCAWHPTGGLVIVGGVLGTIHMLDSTTGEGAGTVGCREQWTCCGC